MPLFSQHIGRGTPKPPSPQAAATLLRRYRPLETRATGGFGSVEVCLDARLQRRVAIKRIPLAAPGAPVAAETVSAALAEARTASMLQHPNIVSVIDFSCDGTYAYLVMEYVDGLSLEEFLSQVDGHSLTYDEAAAVADALCEALAFAHENGVLHLDIKPANVLIDRSGHVKLADFGMATLTSAAGFGGARGGTIGYMPPEQLDGSVVDERSDIFSLATVLYEALCGISPFRAATPAESLALIEDGVEPPHDVLPDIPELSEQALLTALSPAPAARMTDVGAFEERFCAQIGHARSGSKSLARMIARITSDDAEADFPAVPTEDEPEPVDPALGLLGTRWGDARTWFTRALAGVSVLACSYRILAAMGLEHAPALLCALAIGAAAAAAPQIGSALLLCGFITMIVNATAPLAVIVPAAMTFAGGCGWWFVWGRTEPHASASLAATCALGALGAPIESCLAGAVLAALRLPPVSAAAATVIGTVLGRLCTASFAAGGALSSSSAANALVNASLGANTLIAALAAAGISTLLSHAWERYRANGSSVGYIVAAAIPLIACAAALALAHPMEIAALTPRAAANAGGAGIASSIIVGIDLFLFGFKHDLAESDRS